MFALVRARCGGGAAAWVAGVLAAPGTQGGWQLGQQEIQCCRRVWQPVLANRLQYSCLENPPPRQRSLACRDPGGAKCAGYRLPLPQELWPYRSLFFEPLVAGDQKAALPSFPM